MNKKAKILIFCMVFVAKGLFAQKTVQFSSKILPPNYTYKPMAKPIFIVKPITKTANTYPAIPQNFYFNNLGFFCKQEIKLQKITKVPFKFRLGSVESCDRLEGKFKYN